MFDYVRIEGHELPGVDPEKLQQAQGPVRKVTEIDGMAVYEDGDLGGRNAPFQTKDFDRSLSTYVIKDGRLFERRYRREGVPEEERPYHGKPEWDRGDPEGLERVRKRTGRSPSWLFYPEYYREFGSERVAGHEDRDLGYHGDLVFYASEEDLDVAEDRGRGIVEFRARFTHGGLDWIRPAGEGR